MCDSNIPGKSAMCVLNSQIIWCDSEVCKPNACVLVQTFSVATGSDHDKLYLLCIDVDGTHCRSGALYRHVWDH